MRRIAVVVGRFQVAALTLGHKSLIDRALADNDELVVLLGISYSVLSMRDPLTFDARAHMIKESYPSAHVYGIHDATNNTVWSDCIDSLLLGTFGSDVRVRLYGSRDSFVGSYEGCYETVTLPAVAAGSGTDARNGVTPEHAETFRKGMIHAANNRPLVSFQTVDVAVLNHDLGAVLLGQKTTDAGRFRFIGGFVDPIDESLESAAFRELREEAGNLGTSNFRYVGSHRVNDWRYRASPDKICTALFVTDFHYGSPKAADDVVLVKWVPLMELREVIVESHRPLAELLIAHLTNRAHGAKE